MAGTLDVSDMQTFTSTLPTNQEYDNWISNPFLVWVARFPKSCTQRSGSGNDSWAGAEFLISLTEVALYCNSEFAGIQIVDATLKCRMPVEFMIFTSRKFIN